MHDLTDETRTLIAYARRKFAEERWPLSPVLPNQPQGRLPPGPQTDGGFLLSDVTSGDGPFCSAPGALAGCNNGCSAEGVKWTF
jgi:hypothetical protein